VRMLFWRAVTPADFFEIERGRAAAPRGGGGQSYFSISFAGLTYEELGRFLDVSPPSRIGTDRPTVILERVGVAAEPDVRAPLEFASRYRPPEPDDRYRITRQNRQTQERHPAWTSERSFPRAPDDVERGDPLPDLTYTKIYVLRLDDGTYLAGFFDSPAPPEQLPADPRLETLFRPYDRYRSAGLIEFGPGEVPFAAWQRAIDADYGGRPIEVVEALELTRVAAGKRPRGQGFRVNAEARRAVELRAVAVARALLEADEWFVDDVSATQPYDLDCVRGAERLHVEVKGTVSDGASVLLTPGEVRHAREPHDLALVVVSRVELERDPESGEWSATGGTPEVVLPWDIDADGELIATGYEYRRN
jgi:hypothetical protein